jgi:hypothetical protein
MHDWKQIVRKCLRVLGVCSPEFTEELAGHLEDNYEASLRGGMPPEAAFHRTVAQIDRRSQICLTVRIVQEVLMTDFARKVGLPGLLTFALAMAAAIAIDVAHIHPSFLLGNRFSASLPVAWLCLLPFCGAAGTLVSHWTGSSRLQRIAACLFPSVIMAAVVLIILVTGFAISRFVPDSGWNWALAVPGLALQLTAQAVVTAVPLLLGAVAGEQMSRTR